MKRYTLLILTFLLIALGCSNQKPSNINLLITNASIVDVQNDTLLSNKTIAISGEHIVAVYDDSSQDQLQETKIINAEGQYLLPGLWDMHVHFTGRDSLVTENKNLLPLFLVFGVTTVRDAGGDITSAVINWRQQISNGELAGPAIYTSGPKLDDYASPSFIQVEKQQDIEQALDSLESINADYVKLYDFNLSKQAYYRIIKEAEKRGLKTTGHIPFSADMLQAADYGLDGIEHPHYLLKPASSSDNHKSYKLGFRKFFPLVDSFDADLAKKAYRSLAEENLYVTSTLHYLKILAQTEDRDHSTDSLLSYIGPSIREIYKEDENSAERNGEQYKHKLTRLTNHINEMIVPIHNAGINLLARY